MIILVGLGNPGVAYKVTNHNIGFMFVDFLANKLSFPRFVQKFSGDLSSSIIKDRKVFLFKPMTYMNSSGIPLRNFLSFYKHPLDCVLVCHDDVDVPFGKIKIKKGGGAGGHNGLKSIDQSVGSNYWRLRIGVGRQPDKMDLSDYVLGKVHSMEQINLLFESIFNNIDILFSEDRLNLASLLNNKSV